MKKEYHIGPAHWRLLTIAFTYVFLNAAFPSDTLKGLSAIFTIVLFIAYTWRRIFTIIITALIVAALVAVMPFLAPIAFVLMVIIFIMRLNYIVENWRAVLAGFYMYGIAICFLIVPPHQTNAIDMIVAAVMALIVTLIFHFILKSLYNHGYSLDRALAIMGVAPLLIMLLFLPFIKAFDGFDASIDSADTTDVGHDVIDTTTHNAYSHNTSTDTAPGTHYTHDYYRTEPDGTVQHVRGYEATNPDGIVENNFSYNGNSLYQPGSSHSTNADTAMDTPFAKTPSTHQSHHGFEGADAGRTEKGKRTNNKN